MKIQAEQNITDKKSFKWKYTLAVISLLLLITSSLVYIYFTREQGPDPASDTVIRKVAARIKGVKKLSSVYFMNYDHITNEQIVYLKAALPGFLVLFYIPGGSWSNVRYGTGQI